MVCEIANFLYLYSVHYEYERVYEHDTATPEKAPYQPDFYLPDAGIYIEHFGIDAEGKTAPFVPQEKYLESMAWKRRTHAEHGTILIETFSHEHAAGRLIENLTAKLRDSGVTLSPIPPTEVFTVLERQGQIDPFMRLLATFLKHYKGAQLTFREVARRARMRTISTSSYCPISARSGGTTSSSTASTSSTAVSCEAKGLSV